MRFSVGAEVTPEFHGRATVVLSFYRNAATTLYAIGAIYRPNCTALKQRATKICDLPPRPCTDLSLVKQCPHHENARGPLIPDKVELQRENHRGGKRLFRLSALKKPA
jgi:hypothetical protein